MSRAGRVVTGVGSALAAAGAVHAAVNARLLRTPVVLDGPRPRVSVLVPARDEADHIEACLHSLAGQADELVVLDDRSADDTGALARAAGVRVVDGADPPPGWLGKPWACAQLADAADPRSEVLVFVDADVVVEPDGIAATVSLLCSAGLSIACPFPRQLAVSPIERLVQPLLQWSWLTTLPLRLAERDRPALTAACGQLLAVRRDALIRAGGFAAVRGAVLDDVALVRAVKTSGGRGGVVDGTPVAACRMYDGWPALRDGYAKSLWSAFGSPGGAAAVVGLFALAWVVPPVAALRGSRIGLAGYAAGVASRVIAARRTGGRALPDALAHPASVGVFCWLTVRSVWLRRRGTLSWKGRPVDLASGPAARARSRPQPPTPPR